MCKRKPIYIVLMVIFTLLLAADITAYCLTANVSSGMSGMPDRSQMQGGFDGRMPRTSDGTLPEASGGVGDFPDDFDPSQMQGGFDPSDMAGGTGGSTASALVSFISSWWIPIGIFCVLADALCIFMLIRISKKRRQAGGGEADGPEAAEEPGERKLQISGYEKRRRKNRRTVRIAVSVLAVIVVTVLAYVIVNGIYAQLEKENAASIMSADAESAVMDTGISGTGTLTDADAEEITVPNGVKIALFHVEDGDTVEEGDILATVNHTSVMKAIADLNDAMDLLDEQMDAASSDTVKSKITASVDGRIKVIYTQSGEGVADTMYDHGALILISLDGLMAADIETDADISAGDSVMVTFADGSTETGRVDSVKKGIATITVADDGPVYGEEVSAADENGNALGKGALYIHRELKITGYSGTASKIKCSENKKVNAGDTLMTLTDTEYTAEYELLLKKRSDYEAEMLKLFRLYQDGSIYADCAGTISGVDEDAATGITGVSAGTAQAAGGISQTGYTGGPYAIATLVYQAGSASESALLGNNPSGADDTVVEAYTNYAATVSSVSYGAIALKEYPVSLSIADYTDYASLGITSAMMTAETAISPATSTPVYMYKNGAWAAYSVSDIAAGDVLILTYDTSSGTDELVWIVIARKAESGGNTGGGGGSYTGGSGGGSATETETIEPDDLYAISETTVMSVTPGDTMSVTITIDELDILSIAVGQEAAVTLDALSGQTFTGSVTSINTAGTNSGGSTKFTAVVTLGRTEQMLAGMNAAVSVTLLSSECAVAIPVAALIESGSGTFVYTSYDEESRTLGNPVGVTTGLSDGASVEILSGLDPGNKVWYEYDETIDVSSSAVSSSAGGGFNIMRIFGGRG
jgi:multidrug efflux pump subunit AcrA (membrane-fusion protein)